MIDQLIHVIKLRQQEIGASLAAGNAHSWEGYQRMVGEHQGLQKTLDIIDAMLDEDKNQD